MAGKSVEILEYGFLESVYDAGSTFVLDRNNLTRVHYNEKVTNCKKGDKFAILWSYDENNRIFVISVYGRSEIEKFKGTVDYVQHSYGYVSIDSSKDRAIFFDRNLKHLDNRPNMDLRELVKNNNRVDVEVICQVGYKVKYRAVLVQISSETNRATANCSRFDSRDIQHVVLSSKVDLRLDQLQRDFEDSFGYSIPYENLGFNSFLLYLHSIPDLVEITQIKDEYYVRPVCDDKVSHIREMVESQKGAAKPKPVSQEKPKKEVPKSAPNGDQAVITYKWPTYAHGWSKLRGRVFIPFSEWFSDPKKFNPGYWFKFTPEPQAKNNIAWIARNARLTDLCVDFDCFEDLVLKNLFGFVTCKWDDFALIWTEELGRAIVYQKDVSKSAWDDLNVLDNVEIDVHEDKRVMMETCWQTHNIQKVPPDLSNAKVVTATLKNVSNNWKAEFTTEGYDIIVATQYDYYKEMDNAHDFKMELESHSKFIIYIVSTIDPTVWKGIFVRPKVKKKKRPKKSNSEKRSSSAHPSGNERQSPSQEAIGHEPIAVTINDSPINNETTLSEMKDTECQTDQNLLEWEMFDKMRNDQEVFSYIRANYKDLILAIKAFATGIHTRGLRRLNYVISPQHDNEEIEDNGALKSIGQQTYFMMERAILDRLSEDGEFHEMMDERYEELWSSYMLM